MVLSARLVTQPVGLVEELMTSIVLLASLLPLSMWIAPSRVQCTASPPVESLHSLMPLFVEIVHQIVRLVPALLRLTALSASLATSLSPLLSSV